jgi:hypothetical protein
VANGDVATLAYCLERVFRSSGRLSSRGTMASISVSAIAERIATLYQNVCESRGLIGRDSRLLRGSA